MTDQKLTLARVKAAKPGKQMLHVWDAELRGFGMRVMPTGSKSYVLRYRDHRGNQRWKSFGSIDLYSNPEQPREEAREILRTVKRGEDPENVTTPLFEEVAEAVLNGKARGAKQVRPATLKEYRRLLKAELLPAWKGIPADHIERKDVEKLLGKITARGDKGYSANRTLALVRVIYNEASKRGYKALGNPTVDIDLPTLEEARERFLTREEIAQAWKATEENLTPSTAAIFQLALFTTQRIGNVQAMRWDEVILEGDHPRWTIPAEKFKGKREQVVPLSTQAVGILKGLIGRKRIYVFPSRKGAKEPYQKNLATARIRLHKATEIPRWTPHDFRRTFRTHASNPTDSNGFETPGLGVPFHVTDAILGHSDRSVGFQHYQGNKAAYLFTEKAEALQLWADFIEKATQEKA